MLPTLFVGLMAAAWLMPNHYSPWLAAWGEGVAIAGFLSLLVWVVARAPRTARVSWPVVVIVVLGGAALLGQALTGKMLFSGDVLLVALYLCLWLAAMQVGGILVESSAREVAPDILVSLWVFSALLSVGIALVQWTGTLNPGIYVAALPPNGRPFGNVAQPNHLCTICFLGLCGLAWLHQRQQLSGPSFSLGAGVLLLGMVMTQSRTGWLQIGLLGVWLLVMQRRANLRLVRTAVLALCFGFVGLMWVWRFFGDALLLSAGRSLQEGIQRGTRGQHWLEMVDAIGHEPWWGYGWLQVGAAQQRVAVDHPWIGEQIDYSHNLVLDLLLWNGIPIGALIIAALVMWFVLSIRACRDAHFVWLLAAVGGVFTHAMLEYPLAYAYFLIPIGLGMGAVDGLSAQNRALRASRRVVKVASGVMAVIFVWIATEYLQAEEHDRMLRLESAHIGTAGIVTPPPELRLLTQLNAYLQFAHTEAKPGMTLGQLDWMRRVSERYSYQSVMFRYALAAGLNGQPEVAERTLLVLCKIHPKAFCNQARSAWKMIAREQYPELKRIALPPAP